VSTFAGVGLTFLSLLGFAIGYWATRGRSGIARLLAGIVVASAVFLTPTVVGILNM
jgi:ABC-type molybdate transport system permease subunit